VEARVGDAPWRAAQLNAPALSSMTWVQWRVTLALPPVHGSTVTVQAHATDGHGHVQEAVSRPTYPGGATGIHTVTVAL
jgi:hypothetical protein